MKLPVALLALENLQEDDRIDRYTRFTVIGGAKRQLLYQQADRAVCSQRQPGLRPIIRVLGERRDQSTPQRQWSAGQNLSSSLHNRLRYFDHASNAIQWHRR